MADKGRMRQKQNQKAAKAKKHGKGVRIAAVLLIILILAGTYAYLTYGSLPSAILTAKQLNYSAIRAIVLQKEASTPMMSVSYIGSIVVNDTDPYIQVSFLKYYNSSRTTFNFTYLPVVGNVSEVVISLNNGTSGYSCIKSWNSSASANSNYTCTALNSVSYSDFESALGGLVNVSSIGNISTNSYGINIYNGQPCYSVLGSGSVMVNGAIVGRTGFVPSSFTFNACVSAQYDIPVTLGGTLSVGNSRFVHVSIFQSGVNFTTDYGQVASLPSGT